MQHMSCLVIALETWLNRFRRTWVNFVRRGQLLVFICVLCLNGIFLHAFQDHQSSNYSSSSKYLHASAFLNSFPTNHRSKAHRSSLLGRTIYESEKPWIQKQMTINSSVRASGESSSPLQRNSGVSAAANPIGKDSPCTVSVSKPALGDPVSVAKQITESNTGVFSSASQSSTMDEPWVGTPDPLAAYVKHHGGDRPIRKVLIANNGMAATKSIASMRQWAFEALHDDQAIQFVVMATPEDLAANAEYIRKAEKIIPVPGGPNRNNYANVDLICSIARQEEVDAVWPGWGHASENPALPEQLKSMGIRFIGPSSRVMSALGDKIAANILAQTAGVPSIPWSGDGITSPSNDGGVIPKELFKKATVNSVEDCVAACKRIGFPVMIKASEGGGGKGIRMVQNAEGIKSAYEQVCNEVPGSPVFIMKLCSGARHIEVQIVGDMHGNAVALSGRDCSTQRRFQKIFEEAPPTSIVPKDIFKEMELAAQRLTKSLGYVGAGTVEYLYDAKLKKFYFLELNPRLQVEHPVTEGITHVNLPATQLQVTMGIPLDLIPDIRRFYGKEPGSKDRIDFMKDLYPPIKTHVIAARITSENPDEGFKPSSGRLDRLEFNPPKDVWGYFSVSANGCVHEYADSQIGHIFAQGRTRNDARKRLITGLKSVFVEGQIRTPVEVLQQLLEKPEFVDNTLDTSWLDGLIREKTLYTTSPQFQLKAILGAALFRSIQTLQEKWQGMISTLERGQHYIANVEDVLTCTHEIVLGGFRYVFSALKTGPTSLKLMINNQIFECSYSFQSDQSYIVNVDNATLRFRGREEPMGLRLQVDGSTIFLPTVYDPLEFRSDVTGKLVRYLVAPDEVVSKGQPYAEVEAMKMIMTLNAGESGKIQLHKSGGSLIAAGDILATIELVDPTAKSAPKIETFRGHLDWPETEQKSKQTVPSDDSSGENAAQDIDISGKAAERLRLALLGFEQGDSELLIEQLKKGYLAAKLKGTGHDAAVSGAASVLGLHIKRLLEEYLSVEEKFSGQSVKAALEAQEANKLSVENIAHNLVAHSRLQQRNVTIQAILRALTAIPELWKCIHGSALPDDHATNLPDTDAQLGIDLLDLLKRLSQLEGREYGPVCLSARTLFRDAHTPAMPKRVANLKSLLLKSVDYNAQAPNDAANEYSLERLAWLPSATAGLDLLSQLFADKDVGLKAMEVCVRRHYRGYHISNIQRKVVSGVPVVTWEYSPLPQSEPDGNNNSMPAQMFSNGQHPVDVSALHNSLLKSDAPSNTGHIHKGLFALLPSVDAVAAKGPELLRTIEAAASAVAAEHAAFKHAHGIVDDHNTTSIPPMHEFFVAIPPQASCKPGSATEATIVSSFSTIFQGRLSDALHRARIRFASLHVPQKDGNCRRFTFKERDAFGEAVGDRDLCPGIPLLTGLDELNAAFNVARLPSFTYDTYAYLGTPKASSRPAGRNQPNITSSITSRNTDSAKKSQAESSDGRAANPRVGEQQQVVFIRRLVFSQNLNQDDVEKLLLEQLDALKISLQNPRVGPSASGRLFLHLVVPILGQNAQETEYAFLDALEKLKLKYSKQLIDQRVDEIVFKFHINNSRTFSGKDIEASKVYPVTLTARTGNGGWLKVVPSSTTSILSSPDHLISKKVVSPSEDDPERILSRPEMFNAKKPSFSDMRSGHYDADSHGYTSTAETSGANTPRYKILRGAQQGSIRPQGQQTETPSTNETLPFLVSKDKPSVQTNAPGAFTRVDLKRGLARRAGSTYIYDFLGLIESALTQMWAEDSKLKNNSKGNLQLPEDSLVVSEFIMNSNGELRLEPNWSIGDNKVGMVGFLVQLRTPEYPEGRSIVVVGNDITHQGGSFGVEEHRFYAKASEYARKHGIPRIYIACNSGARIGLYDTLKDKIKIKWKDPKNISLGPEYLYLTSDVYEQLPEGVVDGHWVDIGKYLDSISDKPAEGTTEGNQRVFVLDAIIGEAQQYLGVENLRGSGLIAGETSRAYDEIFTLSYVSGRSVGIGAYVVRLGQRVIQMKNGPMLLTGYQALNKLLGRDVYLSQDQLGGPEIMYKNGVSHLVVDNDKEGMVEMLRWLSYVPKSIHEYAKHKQGHDPVERDVEFTPTPTAYDPRCMLAGCNDGSQYFSGILDKNSFQEYLAGWGKSVVVGRGKLGGIPVGVIAVETRTTEASQPADPANPKSSRNIMQQAGQVWFPDSAYKTAQAIRDFDHGERLPLLIFANWRGFSGGTRDMYNEVLKFGSMIVDALREYKHPVFVYIPPHGELRGGSWVVIDPTINPDKMEMYADVNSRGGILEPPGICEIKFRSNVQQSLMRETDQVIMDLEKRLSNCKPEECASLKSEIAKREEFLSPLYTQVAHLYADLHDRAPRMKARGGVRRVLQFKRARSFFYWRIRRRLAVDDIIDKLRSGDATLTWAAAQDLVEKSLLKPAEIDVDDDKCVAMFLSSQPGEDAARNLIEQIRINGANVKLNEILQQLPDEVRQDAIQRLFSIYDHQALKQTPPKLLY